MSRFLQFDSLTLCPIDAVTIIREDFLQEDIDWLNAYHERVFDELAPYHDDDETTWLKLCTNIVNIILQSPPSIFSIILLYL